MNINIETIQLSLVDNASGNNLMPLLMPVQEFLNNKYVHAKIPINIIESPRVGLSSAPMFDSVGMATATVNVFTRTIKMPLLPTLLPVGVTGERIKSINISFEEFPQLNQLGLTDITDIIVSGDIIKENRVFLSNATSINTFCTIDIEYEVTVSGYDSVSRLSYVLDSLEIKDVGEIRDIIVSDEIFEVGKFYRLLDDGCAIDKVTFLAKSPNKLILDYSRCMDDNNQLIDIFFPISTIEKDVTFEVFNPKVIDYPSEFKITKA